MKTLSLLWTSFAVGGALGAQVEQQPFTINQPLMVQNASVTAYGRYLHITDIHMDKHYLRGAAVSSDCHRKPNKHKKKKKTEGLLAGHWGAPNTECDAPPRLVYYNIDYIAKEWKDKIDFVIWTGDNARHDGDALITRTKKEIIGYNRKIARLLKKAFTLDDDRTLPIVPCIGNNDVHPHNELRDIKHNPQLEEFSILWKDFIPEDQTKSFKKGGYFAIDVAPRMRVLSLNTLYFFSSNDVVTTCSDPKGPGHRHIKWMKRQLKHARRDNIKVIIIGHVPPTVKTFKDSCLDDYIRLSTKYADVITGHMYGHSNMDHFQIIGKNLDGSINSPPYIYEADNDDEVSIEKKKDAGRFVSTLKRQYHQAKKIRGTENLVVVNVAPPMLPLFYPTFRVSEYESDLNSSHFGNWLRYTQYYSNLTRWNEARDPITGKYPAPQFEVEYTTDKDYNMTDLTTDSWIDFAQFISSKEGRSVWKEYLANMFVRTNNQWYGQSIGDSPSELTGWDWFLSLIPWCDPMDNSSSESNWWNWFFK
ncbi:endopolyphosphatase [Rhizopus stolonifer]|uniref:Endopolyphosphatase n=1 Tax=Rhizopus stolonifer TaxID=4846 RepID=A0A367KSF3_RHIST|nr:endopolyphosphatase [Rhizopus stolonifer]